MFKYRVTVDGQAIEVSIDVKGSNDRAPIFYSQPSVELQQWLESSYGAFGHKIGRITSAIDLDKVMQSDQAAVYEPELLEGEELVQFYDAGLDEGDVS